MLTLKELFLEWKLKNPYHFQQTLLRTFEGICNAFRSLCDLPYDTISSEMFEALYTTAANKDKHDRMVYLIGRLDDYLLKRGHQMPLHTPLSEEKAVWMILHEQSAMTNTAIRDKAKTIMAHQPITFDKLTAIFLLRNNARLSEASVNFYRKAYSMMKNLHGCTIDELTDEKIQSAISTLPNWLSGIGMRLIQCVTEIITEENHSKTAPDVSYFNCPANIALSKLHDLWLETYRLQFAQNSLNTFNIAWNVISPLGDIPYRDIRTPDIQRLLVSKPATTQSAVKRLYRKLDEFAYALDITHRERAHMLVLNEIVINRHIPFSFQDIEKLKNNMGLPGVNITLALLYTGLRAGELASIRKADVSLALHEMRGGNKSKCSINRLIPLHPVIFPIISRWMDDDNELLIHGPNGSKLSNRYIEEAVKLASSAFCEEVHVPHECRHTFFTRLSDAGVSSTCISMLVVIVLSASVSASIPISLHSS